VLYVSRHLADPDLTDLIRAPANLRNHDIDLALLRTDPLSL